MTEEDHQGTHPMLPTPVRASLGADASTAPATSDVEASPPSPSETRFLGGGREWTVRVLGSSQAGPASAPLPLVLLGFFGTPDGDSPEREALVVGRDLDGFTADHLQSAWEASTAASTTPRQKQPIFPEIGGRGGGRDG